MEPHNCETITVFSYLRIRPFVKSGKGISHTSVNESARKQTQYLIGCFIETDQWWISVVGSAFTRIHFVSNVMLQVKLLTATLYFKSSIIQRQTFCFLFHFIL